MSKKSLKPILLIIGILGLVSGVYGIIKGQDFTDYLVGLICGSALILSAFTLEKGESEEK